MNNVPDHDSEPEELDNEAGVNEQEMYNQDIPGDNAEEDIFRNRNYESGSDANYSDDSDDDYDAGIDRFGQQLVYTGAPITVLECMSLVMSLKLKHNVTNTCISDMLTVIQLHCLRQGLVKLSLHKFEKYFCSTKAKTNKRFYCTVCESPLATKEHVCPVCRERKGASYFIQFPIVPQLKVMYARQNFYRDLQHRFARDNAQDNVMREIYDRRLYKEQEQNGFLSNRNNISFFWTADGVPVYHSRNYSYWGLYLMINELAYKERTSRENIILAGLWFGPQKPNCNFLLESVAPDLRSLYEEVRIRVPGIADPIIVRGILLGGVGDIPAKSSFMNIVGHRGFFCCHVCEISGENKVLPSGGETMTFPFNPTATKRTVERMQEQARQALQLNDPVMGVKGPTALRLIIPDFLRGMGIDPMHLCAGTTKKLMTLHFDSKFSGYPFSLRAVLGVVDQMLLKIKPPRFIHRMPRSVEDLCHWHCSELKNYLFYYSVPILKQVMQPVYFNNYLKLVTGLSYLSAASVTPIMVERGRQLLHEFVRDFENLYALDYCTINVHLLLHLPDACLELGPSWVFSCFPLENLHGLTVKNIHGTTHADSQICNAHWKVLTMPMNIARLNNGMVKDFCLKSKKPLKLNERIFESCYSIGAYVDAGLDHPVIQEGLNTLNAPPGKSALFFRLLKNRLVYVSEKYTRATKTSSSYVMYRENDLHCFGSVFTFLKTKLCQCIDECACGSECYAIFKRVEEIDTFVPTGHNESPLL